MWLKRPNALSDGILLATAIGLVLSAIVIIKGASSGEQYLVPLCQEVVVDVEKDGNILARCPAGTYIEIDTGANVLCRCPNGRAPDRAPTLFIDPMPTEPKLTEPPRPRDDKSIQL